MKKELFIDRIQAKDFDKKEFTRLALDDEQHRSVLVDNMINHKKIMIYYHCYEVLKEAIAIAPRQFERYKIEFVALLKHDNSYHRDFGLTLLSSLISRLKNLNFHEFSDDYFVCLNDQKFMTAQCCLANLKQIITFRTEYTTSITDCVLYKKNFKDYKEKQRELIYSDVIALLEVAYHNGYDQERIRDYVNKRTTSISPKTRKLAKSLSKVMTL